MPEHMWCTEQIEKLMWEMQIRCLKIMSEKLILVWFIDCMERSPTEPQPLGFCAWAAFITCLTNFVILTKYQKTNKEAHGNYEICILGY